MSRKAIVALFIVAAACLALPSGAFAHGPHGGGGGFHSGGGFHGGGFHGGGFRGGWGLGFYGPYGYPFGYDDYYSGDEMNCYLVRQRVHTRHGWRIRRVEICD